MDKRPETMTEQERLLEIQFAHASRNRASDILSMVLTLGIVFALAIAFFVIPDVEFSEAENRYLRQTPRISSSSSDSLVERIKSGKLIDRLLSGEFTAEVAEYYADQFPMRDAFVGLKGATEIAMLKGENNGIVVGRDGYIIERNDYPNLDYLRKNVTSLGEFAAKLDDAEIPLTLAFAGRSVDVLVDKLPALYPTGRSESAWATLTSEVEKIVTADRISLLDTFADASSFEHQIYYRTDHHWTSWGAYYAYRDIAMSLGVEPLDESELTVEVASDEFYGTTWSKAGMKWVAPDELLYLRYSGDENFTVKIADNGSELVGFYDRSYLDKKDKYSSFISGNNALVYVTKTGAESENRPKLLLVKDSFSHSMVPFLAYHFDLVIVDNRYYKQSTLELAASEGVDGVLVLVNLASLTDSNLFGMLAY